MKIISPIAIDMGAKNTGVYYAKYESGPSFKSIEKQGQVLVYDKYTALLKDRTANRHARRGYQRSKLAKRLLVLILENYFKFPAKQHSQAIGFLLNRRGFTFLDEQYSKDHLANFPVEAWNELSDEVRNLLGDKQENIADELISLSTNHPEKITAIFNAIQEIEGYKTFQKKEEEIKKEFVYFDYIEKINKACDIIENGEITDDKVTKNKKDKQKLSETSNWIIERLNKEKNTHLTVDDSSYKTSLIRQITPLNFQQLQQSLPDFEQAREQIKNEQTENNKSIWNFNITNFAFNDKNETGLVALDAKIHLHHFCYAIYKINNEIISGARHRSKYFEEIKTDLEKFTSNDFLDNRHSPKYLVEFVKALKSNGKLDKDKLFNLICHISNLELKPLRAYFNDKTPIKRNKDYKKDNQSESNFISHSIENGGDTFNLEKLSRLASVWFLKNWRVNAEKDNQEKVDSYKKLKTAWKNHNNKNDVVNFWLKTCPILTIPPYQSMNNRRPPKCQTLLLNGDYLNKHYSDWREWLKLLESDTEYKEKLQNLKSGKGGKGSQLIDDDLIELRQLQFILDTAKKRDKYKLNEIWSIHRKLQQLIKDSDDIEESEKWKSKLDEAKKNRQLPDVLKQSLDFSVTNGFWHFINKYYKTRKKARDGRYFIHQRKKGEWITDDKLLTVCTHKPKQKKHQWKIDLAAMLGIDEGVLEYKLKDKNDKKIAPEIYFKDIKGTCEKAAKAQKNHRGELKHKIGIALVPELKGAGLPKGEAKDLLNLANRCHALKNKLIKKIGIDDLLADKQSKENDKKIALVFKFSQINNIVFKERSGFSKTCPVCSTDNGFRMREDDKGIANASRLPAMSIRLIDGLVMRICDAVSRQVATTCWDSIEDDLNHGRKVSIPLIFEQNRFEFEPSLAKIKGKTQELTDDRDDQYREKKQCIKKSAKGICAYFGTPLGNGEEIDHIVPQASKYGTLNDEANLIYVSKLGNQDKGKQSKFLDDLNQGYKNKIFDNKTDEEIKEFIYKQLEGKGAKVGVVGNEDYFEFGRYLSFINLTNNKKIAFRHALFLLDDDPLKQKVINALQNRNRAIVNGTQRYMAQCIADKIYKIARGAGKEKQIEFDYFEYTARADDPKSTYNLRRFYGISKPKKQPLYSHLIDAQMAFLLAADEHKNDGTMGIKFEENQTIWQEKVDKTTGEVLPSESFNNSTIGEDGFLIVNLSRKKSETGVRLHRPFHRPNFYAESYVPLFVGKNDKGIEVRAGFSWQNSAEIKMNDKNRTNIYNILKFAKYKNISTWNGTNKTLVDLHDFFPKKIQCDDFEVFYIDWDKTRIQKYLVDEFSNESISNGKSWSDEICFLRKLSYKTRKQKITKSKDIEDVLNNVEVGKTKTKKYFDIKQFGEIIELPVKNEWEELSTKWKAFNASDDDFTSFIGHYFKQTKDNKHQKVRNIFSLPVVDQQGHFLQKRQSWNGQDIYQISSDSDSRFDGNKFSRKVREGNNLKAVINEAFLSKKTFKLEIDIKKIALGEYDEIDPNRWYEIENNNDFPNGINKIFYKVDSTTRPKVRLYLSDNFNSECIGRISLGKGKRKETEDKNKILENSLTKAKENKTLNGKLTIDDIPSVVEYVASGYTQEIERKLLVSLSKK